ncbi:hypothetical protein C439_10745 [Haloferax mediterranei ATCC 33500]|nr:hypothetical protein BM92_09670 [Haloferax mediterranei ATCC 33500]EMA03056.1 hypothetical protein C439_10745 [Haloferax mediterranei ATCC 33500]
MPTGTVSRDGSGSRTYPPNESGHSSPPKTASPRQRTRSNPGPDQAALQRENEALRRANAQLKARLAAAGEDRQEIIDRYEQLLAESRRRSRNRGGQSPNGQRSNNRRSKRQRRSNHRSSSKNGGQSIATVRAAVGRAVSSVASSLGLR